MIGVGTQSEGAVLSEQEGLVALDNPSGSFVLPARRNSHKICPVSYPAACGNSSGTSGLTDSDVEVR